MNRTLRFCVTALALVAAAAPASAKTIYSFGGLGDPVQRTDVRALGMGGAGMALADGFSFSMANPALLGAIRVPIMSSRYVIQRRSIEGLDGRSHTLSDSDIGAIRVALPVKQGSVLGIGLEPLTDMDFSLTDSVSTGPLPYRLRIEGTGGVQSVSLAFGQKIDRFYVGTRLDVVVMGTVSETWTRGFGSELQPDATNVSHVQYLDTSDRFVRTYRGMVPALGAVYTPTQSLYLGLSLQPRRTITQTETLKNFFAERGLQEGTTVKSDVDLPASISLGAAYRAGHSWLAALDMTRTYWGGTGAGRYDTVELAAGGLYRMESGDLLSRRKRLEFTGGLHYRSLYYPTATADQIAEKGLSLGITVPLRWGGGGRAHYVIEFGSRGDTGQHGVSERYIMQTFAISGFLR